MTKVNKQNSLILILIVVIVVLLAAVIMLWYKPADDSDDRQNTTDQKTISDDADTADDSDDQTDQPDATQQFTSEDGVTIKLDDLSANQTVASPLEVEGQVPGSWSNEAIFSIEVRDNSGNLLGQGRATLSGDWMTEAYVPFDSTVSFTVPSGVTAGQLVLVKANPSGQPANADSVTIPVKF